MCLLTPQIQLRNRVLELERALMNARSANKTIFRQAQVIHDDRVALRRQLAATRNRVTGLEIIVDDSLLRLVEIDLLGEGLNMGLSDQEQIAHAKREAPRKVEAVLDEAAARHGGVGANPDGQLPTSCVRDACDAVCDAAFRAVVGFTAYVCGFFLWAGVFVSVQVSIISARATWSLVEGAIHCLNRVVFDHGLYVCRVGHGAPSRG